MKKIKFLLLGVLSVCAFCIKAENTGPEIQVTNHTPWPVYVWFNGFLGDDYHFGHAIKPGPTVYGRSQPCLDEIYAQVEGHHEVVTLPVASDDYCKTFHVDVRYQPKEGQRDDEKDIFQESSSSRVMRLEYGGGKSGKSASVHLPWAP